jgi:hypothetical protein
MAHTDKSLKDCTLKFLDKNFKLRQPKNLPSLTDWLNAPYELSNIERKMLEHYRDVLEFNVHDWNEYELDTHFIGPIFSLVNFSSYTVNHFSQRDIEGVVGNFRLYGRPDGMVASGRREPEKPYFAFQEYKRELDPDGDPAGQALGAMLIGQSLDETTKPMYGCYVVGNVWRFMTLEGNEYAISHDYSAITDELFDIFRILKSLKTIVHNFTL